MHGGRLTYLEKQLFSAVLQSNIGETIRLISLKANINAKNQHGNTPVHIAVLCRDTLMVKTLVQLRANINTKNGIGFTALSMATISNNPEVVKTLLRLGAKHDICNSDGNFPIHLAAKKGYLDVIKILLREDTVNICNNDGFAPLHLAVLHNHISAVEILMDYCHTDINIRDNKNENTALILAVQKDNLPIVKFLLKNKADFGWRNKAGKTFNEFAISNEMKSLVFKYEKLLNKFNADPTQSLSSKPLVHKRKKYLSTSSSSESGASRLLMPKHKKYMDQPSTSSLPSEPSIRKYKTLSDLSNISSPQSEASMRKYKTLSDLSNISLPQPEASRYRYGRSSSSSINSPRSSISETTMCKLKRHLNMSNESSSESNISCSAKRIRRR